MKKVSALLCMTVLILATNGACIFIATPVVSVSRAVGDSIESSEYISNKRYENSNKSMEYYEQAIKPYKQ